MYVINIKVCCLNIHCLDSHVRFHSMGLYQNAVMMKMCFSKCTIMIDSEVPQLWYIGAYDVLFLDEIFLLLFS